MPVEPFVSSKRAYAPFLVLLIFFIPFLIFAIPALAATLSKITTSNVADLTPDYVTTGQLKVPMMDFTVKSSDSSEKFHKVDPVTYTGTSANDVSAVYLYRESGTSGGTFDPATDVLMATDSDLSNGIKLDPPDFDMNSTVNYQFYIVVDIKNTATSGNTVDVKILKDDITFDSGTWPNDADKALFDPAGYSTITKCGNGVVDSGEQCDGGNCCNADCTFKSPSTVCRAANGACDVAEMCTGTGALCPADSFLSDTTLCRASAGACDVADYCSGSGAACTTDIKSTAVCRAADGVCDVSESCNGVDNACPADAVRENGYVCAAESAQCDADDTCDGTNKYCNEKYASSGTSCNDGLFCNDGETCDGAGACTGGSARSCSASNIAGIATCDNNPDNVHYTWDSRNAFTSTCDENANECPTGSLTINHQIPTIGTCDVACLTNDDCNNLDTSCADGVCNMNTYTCEQQFKSSSTVCREANGECDVAEQCTGSSATCPGDAVKLSTEVCRGSQGVCDVVDYCDGTTKACPADAKSIAVCRAADGICDVAESCNGVSNDCPADGFKANTFECRAVGGLCDVAEMCTGTGALCPSDSFLPDTTVCRAQDGECDIEEKCTGTDAACPADAIRPSDYVCAVEAGQCDADDTCDGTTKACNEIYASSVTPCDDGLFCNVDETCNGAGTCTDGTAKDCSGNNLPGIATCNNDPDNIHYTWDSRNPFTSTCDETTDSCTNGNAITINHQSPTIETCDVHCLSNSDCSNLNDACADGVCNLNTYTCDQQFKPVETECRASAGGCDVAEQCTGSSATCPPDAVRSAGYVCAAESGQCDADDTCDGTHTYCNENYASSGTSCDDGLFCNVGETCNGAGACTGGSTRDCSDSNECTYDSCNEDTNVCENPNKEYGTYCGLARDCLDDQCDGPFGKFYPDDGHDYCNAGSCVEYSCAMQNSYCCDNDPLDGINSLECGAQCDQNSDCSDTSCTSLSGCYLGGVKGSYGILRTYSNVANTCNLGTCGCSQNSCGAYSAEADNDGDGYSVSCGDCDDTNANIHPGATETCNGVDDDCDASIDEDFTNLGDACTVGVGVCQNSGTYVCKADETGTECNAVAGSPTGISETICNGNDDDCDGTADENYVSDQSCFLSGACAASNVGSSCTAGVETACSTGTPSVELCDGLDNDCDGQIDEDCALGKIIIIKDTVPDGPQDFHFTTTGLSDFDLDDDADGTLSNTQTFYGLASGSYTVTEDSVSGFDLSNLVCDDPSDGTTVDLDNRIATIDLTSGETVTCTFTNTKRGTIIVEKQTDPNGAPGSFTFTGTAAGTISDNGQIVVSDLVPGTYTSTESDPTPSFDLTSIVCDDGSSQTPSSGDVATRTATFKVDPGETVKCIFTNIKLGEVRGIKFKDINGDGKKDFGETGLSGWTIYADLNDNERRDGGEPSTRTSFDGSYILRGLSPGTYTVREVVKKGWIQTMPVDGYTVTVSIGSVVSGKDFGNFKLGSIMGVKFRDTNGNGIKDSGEIKLPGWTIYLDMNDNGIHDSEEPFIVTDRSGRYEFTGLLAGTYHVREVLQDGWAQTTPAGGKHTVTIVSGSEISGKDFGNMLGEIRGIKFEDKNGNGVKDPGEKVLQGWRIYLDLNNNGRRDPREPSDTTDRNGEYWFMDLTPGTYTVREIVKSGWVQTAPADGKHTIIITNGNVETGKDFGNFKLGSISGIKFKDTNGNGVRNAGESRLSGWTIYLDKNDNGALDPGEQFTVTAASGKYEFTNLGPGTYNVREVLQNGWAQTYPSAPGKHIVVLTSGLDVTGKDFGNKLGEIHGMKFEDKDGDGINDFGDIGLSGWTIYLDLNNNGRHDREEPSEVTDRNGEYEFLDLLAGTYTVREVMKSGWTQTAPADGKHDVVVTNGEVVTGKDFGNFKLDSISGIKFRDTNGNGVRNTGEAKLAGWTIFLDKDDDGVLDPGEQSTITAASGKYEFTNLGPGTYNVREVLPAGWTQTFPLAPGKHTVVLISGLDATGKDFGNKAV